jgi:hypothetical protein
VADFSEQTMNMEPFDRARDLGAAFPGKFISEVFVLKATDRELSACYGFKKQLVLIVKEIEAFVGTLTLNNGLRACLKRSLGCESTHHQFDHGNANHVFTCFW